MELFSFKKVDRRSAIIHVFTKTAHSSVTKDPTVHEKWTAFICVQSSTYECKCCKYIFKLDKLFANDLNIDDQLTDKVLSFCTSTVWNTGYVLKIILHKRITWHIYERTIRMERYKVQLIKIALCTALR